MVTATTSIRPEENDPERRNSTAHDFEERLQRKVVGQDEAAQAIFDLYQDFSAHLNSSGQPIGNPLFPGPMGTGRMCGRVDHFERNFANCRKITSYFLIK